MAEFTVNPSRFDPYKDFKFNIIWDGKVIPGISKVSELKRTTNVVSHREGGDRNIFHSSPGLTSYDPIILARGRTHDTEFEKWVSKVWNINSGDEVSLSDFRKDIIINLLNEAGQIVMSFQVFRCWPSEYIPMTTLDSGESSILYESITLQHEGWLRDFAVSEPSEPSFTVPKK